MIPATLEALQALQAQHDRWAVAQRAIVHTVRDLLDGPWWRWLFLPRVARELSGAVACERQERAALAALLIPPEAPDDDRDGDGDPAGRRWDYQDGEVRESGDDNGHAGNLWARLLDLHEEGR